MDAHIDWLSWTLPVTAEPVDIHDLKTEARIQLKGISNGHYDYCFDGQAFDQAPGRAPYRYSLQRGDGGFRVFGVSHTHTVLYELSGRGCEGLVTREDQQTFAHILMERFTRIDYAVDIRCETDPMEFCDNSEPGHFRSRSDIRSDTGTTCYVGSPKSGRFARIYRYNPPHPRADLLRCEFVFRGKLARAFARDLCSTLDQQELVARLGNTYGFLHPVWQPGVETDEKVLAPHSSKKEQDTVRWLYKQVVPAMRRMLKSGALNMTDFLEVVYQEE